jgi:hypothetical protein
MNKKLVVIAMGLALLMSAVASAQTVHLKTNVPFNFIAGHTRFPAGQYELLSTGNGDNVLEIRSLNSKDAALVLSNSCESRDAAAQTKLVFHRYGNRYFLSAVWTQGDNVGHQVRSGSWEVEVAKDSQMSEVVLIAKRN